MDPDMSTGCKQEIRLETSEPSPTTGDTLIQARSHLLPSRFVFAPARFNVLTPIGKALRLGRKYRNVLIAVDALSWLTAHWHRNPTFPSFSEVQSQSIVSRWLPGPGVYWPERCYNQE